MKYFVFLIVLLCNFYCVIGLKDDLVDHLPGLPHQPNFNQYSGFLNAQGSKKLHYWFVESQSKPETDPVVLWLNGGPGCSSLDGLLSEHGPFLVNDDGKTLRYNPYSWNKIANILYLEAPAGVGFSYSPDIKDYATDDDTVSMDNFVALLDFFEKFPQFKQNVFFVTGESYGGIYVPTLSMRILQNNSSINMQGFAVGNGLSSYEINTNSLVFFAYYHGLLGDEMWAQAKKYCCQEEKCNFFNPTDPDCRNIAAQIGHIIQDIGLNIYGLYQNCSGLKSKDVRFLFALRNVFFSPNTNHNHVGKFKLRLTPPCINGTAITNYLKAPSVREALHIPKEVQAWTICSAVVADSYRRVYMTVFPIYKKLLQHYRSMVYNGDTDMACNFLGDQHFVNSLGLQTLQARHPWMNRHQVAGFAQEFQNLTFVTIKGAGHMVPEDRPPEAFQMFNNFLKNKPMELFV